MNASDELVLDTVAANSGAPGAPKKLRRSTCGPACAFLGNKESAGTGLGGACFQGRQALLETGANFGATLPKTVLQTKPK